MTELTCKDVLIEHDKIPNVKALYIGYDFGKCRLKEFSDVVMNSLVDFAFGYHKGILKTYNRTILKEAAKSLYRIEDIKNYKTDYIDKNMVYDDEVKLLNAKYFKRGEFGELILHCILRDYFETMPLLSKIYFKDSYGMTVHGFDSVHIGPSIKKDGTLSLFLGESKMYYRKNGDAGKEGIKDLVKDIEEHFKIDFFKDECSIIAKKDDSFVSLDDYTDKNTFDDFEKFLKNKNKFMVELNNVNLGKRKLEDFINLITVPLICTYESSLFKNHKDDNCEEFKVEYEKEITQLNEQLKE